MAVNIQTTLRATLTKLNADRAKVDHQISILRTALAGLNGRIQVRRLQPVRRPMSAAARKAIGKRMKAYWAKRRAKQSASK